MRAVIGNANVDLPKGTLNSPRVSYTVNTNEQLPEPDRYGNLTIDYQNGSPVRVRDTGRAMSGPENDLLAGWTNEKRGIILDVQRQPDANVVSTVDAVKAALPRLQASIPPTSRFDPVGSDADDPCVNQRRAVHPAAQRRARGHRDLPVPAQSLSHHHSSNHHSACAHRHLRSSVCAGVQPRQPVTDGVDHRCRLRGR